MKKEAFPITLCSLSYSDIYDDFDTVDPHSLLQGIPSVSVVHHIAMLQNRVAYILGNSAEQIRIIREFCPYLPQEVRLKANEYIRRHSNKVSFVDSSTCFLMYALALQNFIAHDPEDTELDLCTDECEAVFKAMLYCNQRWTNDQIDGISDFNDLTELSVRADLPIVEFKYYKDFKPQIYKAIQFFRFVETDKYYSTILPHFYADNKVNSWQDYLARLFSFYSSTLNSHIVTVPDTLPEVQDFFDLFIVDISQCANLWTDNNAITYFREHFLLKLTHNTYLLLNPNLLVDKLYQGLKFMFAASISKHSLPNKKGKPFDANTLTVDFLSQLGEDFSEPHLMYHLFNKIFAKRSSAMFTGTYLKSQKIPAEPDLYLRIGDVLYLVEHKDLALGDKIRYSHDYRNVIRPAICDRICLYTDKKHKGFGQLLYSMENIFLKGVMDTLDPDVKNVKTVVPLILTTDRAFSSLGMQRVLIEEGMKMLEKHPISKPLFIAQPIIVDFDILATCGYRLQSGNYNLDRMIAKYLDVNALNLSPFNTFVIDHYLKKALFTEEDVRFISEGLI